MSNEHSEKCKQQINVIIDAKATERNQEVYSTIIMRFHGCFNAQNDPDQVEPCSSARVTFPNKLARLWFGMNLDKHKFDNNWKPDFEGRLWASFKQEGKNWRVTFSCDEKVGPTFKFAPDVRKQEYKNGYTVLVDPMYPDETPVNRLKDAKECRLLTAAVRIGVTLITA